MTLNAETAFDPVSPPPGSPGSSLQQSRLWPVELQVLDDAQASARPFTGDDMNAEDRAWSARVDAAVQGMDVVAPAALDAWMQAHADSATPHLEEAELVAIWETHIRDLYTDHEDGQPAAGTVWIETAMDRADAETFTQAAPDLRLHDDLHRDNEDVLADVDGWA